MEFCLWKCSISFDIKINQHIFSGVTLEGGKRYAQTVQKSFHISMAALEPQQGKVVQSGKSNQSSDLGKPYTLTYFNLVFSKF